MPSKSSDMNKSVVKNIPSPGTNVIPRNRRGLMSRSGMSKTKTQGRNQREGKGGSSSRSSGVIGRDIYQQHPIHHINQRPNSHYSSSLQQNHLYDKLSTHIDNDDREILIESALGNDNHYNDLRDMKSRRKSRGYNSNKRSYSPLKGRDIFTEEEMKSLTYPTPDSIFEIPPFVRKYKRIVLRILVILIGMLVYFVYVTASSRRMKLFKEIQRTKVKESKSSYKSVETDVDISTITSKNVFKDNNEVSRLYRASKDKTMDMGYTNGEDDMVNEEALQKVKVNQISKAVQQKQTELAKGGKSTEKMHDGYVEKDPVVKGSADDANIANHAYLAQVESNSKPQSEHGSGGKAIMVDTSNNTSSSMSVSNQDKVNTFKEEIVKDSVSNPTPQNETAATRVLVQNIQQ